MSAFHEQIKAARLKAKMTQRQAAKQADCDHTYLSKIESGTMEPSADLILRLATIYNADALALMEAAGKTLCRCSADVRRLEERIECLEAAILGMGGHLYEKQT